MNAETRNVNSLFSGTQTYRVRLYQRHYIWDESDWEALWGDVKEKSDLRLRDENSRKEHFTGTIIIQPEGGSIELLDGQQRLITFQILLCAIRDIWMVFDNTEAAEGVHRLIENEGFNESESTERYKLLPREGSDRETFLSIVEKKMVINAAESIDEGAELIRKAYWYFRVAIAKYVSTDYDKLNNLYHTIIDDFTVVQIEVTSDDQHTRIFELIDGRDKGLGAFDLLRNHLFLRAGTGKVRDELYRKYWCPFLKFQANFFLAHFLKSKGRIKNGAILEPTPWRLDNRLFDAYQIYRRELSEKLNLDESNPQFIKHEFDELNRYAQVYKEIHDSDSEIGGRLKIYDHRGSVGGLRYVSSRFINELGQFILYIKNELGVSDSLLTSVLDFMESLIIRFALCTGEEVDSPIDLDADESFDFPLLRAIFGDGDPSIFSYLEDCLLSNVLDINMMRNNLSSGELLRHSAEFPVEFRKFKIFPPQAVEKALVDYRQDQVPGEYTDMRSSVEASVDWGGMIRYILYEIELMIAKEKGITETDFSKMLKRGFFRPVHGAQRLLEHYPENIGNLTVCPSLWDVNDEWDVKEIGEREEKLIEYFNKRWPSMKECLDKIIQPAKCELIDTNEGIKELSQIVVRDTHIEGIDRNDNQRVVLDKDNIFFTCAAAAWSRLKPYIKKDETLKGQALEPIQLNDGILRRDEEVVAVTRSGHVLRGEIEDFNEDAIDMTINEESVIVFKRGLYEFETMEQFEVQVSNFIQDPQNQQYGILEVSAGLQDDDQFTRLFGENSKQIYVHISQVPNADFHLLQPGQKIAFNIAQTRKGLYARNIILRGVFYEMIRSEEPNLIQTYEGTRELSQIVVHDAHIEGVDCNDNRRVVLDKNSILFVCSTTVWSILKPYIQENTAVKEHALGPIQSPAAKFQVKDWILESAQWTTSDVVAVTRSGHVLRGKVEDLAKDLIGMKIRWGQLYINVIVFTQGLYQLKPMNRFEVQVDNFIQDSQNEGDGIIEFSSVAFIQPRRSRRQNRFIEFGDRPEKIHVHISQVPNADLRLLQPGQRIALNITQTEEGLYVRNITLLDPESEERPVRRRRRRRPRRLPRS